MQNYQNEKLEEYNNQFYIMIKEFINVLKIGKELHEDYVSESLITNDKTKVSKFGNDLKYLTYIASLILKYIEEKK